MSFIINAFRFGGGGVANQFIIVKSADETRNSTITLADDSELVSGTLEANSVYLIKAHLKWAADAQPDIIFGFGRTGLSDASLYWDLTSVLSKGPSTIKTWGDDRPGTGAGDSTVRACLFFGAVSTGTNTGTVAVQWAQKVSSANDTSVLAGSHLIIEKAS